MAAPREEPSLGGLLAQTDLNSGYSVILVLRGFWALSSSIPAPKNPTQTDLALPRALLEQADEARTSVA